MSLSRSIASMEARLILLCRVHTLADVLLEN